MNTEGYYAQNKQYGKRYLTDREYINMTEERRFFGVSDKWARFIEENQLMNEEDWSLFVKQFEIKSDDVDSGWRGEYFGKMMRGGCMTYQYTKNERLYAILEKASRAILNTQEESGRISSYFSERELCGWDMWSRKYVLLGLLFFHEICRSEELKKEIETALSRHLDYIADRIGDGDKINIGATSVIWLGINSASILEPVMRMFNLTGKPSYLELARHIVAFLTEGNANIVTLALENELMPYQYPVNKAYEMMSCFEGIIEYYRVTGEEKWKRAAVNFADALIKSDITVIGCAGCYEESFDNAVRTQTDPTITSIMQETCVTVTWMKLCAQLLLLTGDGKYADQIERSQYNALYGAVNSEKITANGGYTFDSYSPLTKGRRGRVVGGYKNISADRYYGCCVAIGAAGTSLPLHIAALTTKKGVALNLYEKGRVTANGLSLDIKTEYPADGKVEITVTDAEAEKKEIALRIPEFSGCKTKVSLNGRALELNLKNGYFAIEREWKSSDRIEMTIDMSPRAVMAIGVEGNEESKNYFALLYGPLVLAADARITEVGAAHLYGDIEIAPKESPDLDCLLRADVKIGSETVDMIDYGSAGKTWTDASLTEAWLKMK